MKYLTFAWDHYYPDGGINDLVGSADDYEGALISLRAADIDGHSGQTGEIWLLADDGEFTRVGFYKRETPAEDWQRVFGLLE